MKGQSKWIRSFRNAFSGFRYALATQRNMKFHVVMTCLVLFLAFLLNIKKIEMLFVFLAISLLIMAELINTAIEKTVDLAMPDQHPVAKIAKDVSAAAVLVTAVFAVIVGFFVFFEPLVEFFLHFVFD